MDQEMIDNYAALITGAVYEALDAGYADDMVRDTVEQAISTWVPSDKD